VLDQVFHSDLFPKDQGGAPGTTRRLS
jgi:hypothetical protein